MDDCVCSFLNVSPWLEGPWPRVCSIEQNIGQLRLLACTMLRSCYLVLCQKVSTDNLLMRAPAASSVGGGSLLRLTGLQLPPKFIAEYLKARVPLIVFLGLVAHFPTKHSTSPWQCSQLYSVPACLPLLLRAFLLRAWYLGHSPSMQVSAGRSIPPTL